MELSILLAEQILSMFLTMIVGYIIVKIGLFKETDSKIISNMVVYICSPCVIIDAFQIELTDDKLQGLLIAVVAAICVHIVMIGGTKLMEKPLHFNRIEKASVIYSNSGYLLIPLVGNVLGKEWVFYKEIFLNPNMIAMFLGMLMFISRIRLPQVIGTCVSSFGDMISSASMLVIGMVIGNVDLKWVFRQKRPYLICFIRLIFYPVIGAVAFGVLGSMEIHPDAEYILMIVFLATAAPVAAMVTQLAQIYDQDVKYASVINVMSVIFCIITMPCMVMLYESFF